MPVSNPEVYVSVTLSLAGSLFTLFTYFLFPDLRTNSRSFATWLAIGGLGYSTTIFFRADRTQGLSCMIEAFFESYFALVTLFTTVIYSVTIARLFATLNSSSNVNKHTIVVKPSHIVFVWILPFGIALLPFTTGSYGRNRSDLYCWIKTDTHNETTNNAGYAWEFFTLYLWVIMAISYNFFVYSTVVRRIHQWQGTEPYIVRTKAVVNRMMLYPFILAAVYTAPLIHRLMEPFGTNPMWLIRMSIFTLKLQGFLDAVAYGLSPAIIVRWKLVLCSLYTYIVTGKFIMLTDDQSNPGAKAGGAQATPSLFKHYHGESSHGDVDIELTDSQHNSHSHTEVDQQPSHQQDEENEDAFEEGLKVYDVYSGTEDEGAHLNMSQPGVGGRGKSDGNSSNSGGRPKTFSATGLTDFYGDDFDY